MGKTMQSISAIAKDINEKNQSLTAFASTGDVDRDGEIIIPKAFENTLAEYRKNPVVLWAHNHAELPVGKSLEEKITEQGLIFTPQFADHDKARDVFKLYKSGYLNAFSVGFMPLKHELRVVDGKEIRHYTEVELFEVSAVPVPSNRGALALRQITGSDTLKGLSQEQVTEALIRYDIEIEQKNAAERAKVEDEIAALLKIAKEEIENLRKRVSELTNPCLGG